MQTSLLLARARARAILWPNKSRPCGRIATPATVMATLTQDELTLKRSPLGRILLAQNTNPQRGALDKTLNPRHAKRTQPNENASTGVVSEARSEWVEQLHEVCDSGAGVGGE